MADSQENPYDVIPYEDKPFHFTHPRHLETVASLFGMSPKPIGECRVLELGCAGGGNIIPMAIDLPGSRFLGIDLSEYQIKQGCELVAELGIENIQLRQTNILDIDECWGAFDYIICHGIFSWVPDVVKEKILKVCRGNLAPQGVAVISYNAYPGWHQVRAIRDLMLHHVRNIVDPQEKIAQARSILAFVAKSSDKKRAFCKAYEEELELMKKTSNDSHIFHEFLEQDNDPLYFRDFMAQSESQGLQYLSNSSLKGMLPQLHPPEIRDVLAPLSLVEQEQYMDFIRGTRFRQTLLCHREVALSRNLSDTKVMDYHIGLSSVPDKVAVNIHNDDEVTFKSEDGTLTTANRTTKAAVMYLKEVFPDFIHFDKLYQTAISRSGLSIEQARDNPDTRPETLAGHILLGVFAGMFKPCLNPPRYVGKLGTHPVVGQLPRLQAARGNMATSKLHVSVRMNDVMRHVVRRLDGKHARGDLVQGVREAVDSGEIIVTADGKRVERVATADIATAVDKTLEHVVEMGLLI